MSNIARRVFVYILITAVSGPAYGAPEYTPESEQALQFGLEWLAANQGADGNWKSNDVGLVSLGALAFLAAGHAPGRGKYGAILRRALDFVVDQAQPTGPAMF